MEFYEELLLTAVVSILLAFLIGKLAALGGTEGDLGRDVPADAAALPAAIGRGGEVFIEERRESVGESGGLGVEKVDDGCGSEAVLGSEGMEASEVEEEGERLERERLLEYILEKAQEVRTREFDQEEENIVEETFAKEEIVKTVDDLVKEGDGFPKDKVGVEKVMQLDEGHEGTGEEKRGIEEKWGSLLYGEDDWEGIEKSELEKLYGVAAAYADSKDGKEAVSRLSSDVQMQLYGLQKVATEGPCYEPQPMALKVTARSKWSAWQGLGTMIPEVAMEQYVNLLSEKIPGWRGEKTQDEAKHNDGTDSPMALGSGKGTPDSNSSLFYQPSSLTERLSEDSSCTQGDDVGGPKPLKQGT
ncbi:acyl-CoA-binding domain-containing protein 5-like isoform X2 [Phoenix dactylifera]|uniref:Acyl-CoA-binding domain-containing protein 5-like isoform X2 n=1 Tax=Phoenix dactylifera TaxID=42345 RepID=A0A8B8J475_PHODC|nr:acyl-CoA-binding domain-containing protein 5-like isoform X2 [Phoenix dactylifera]